MALTSVKMTEEVWLTCLSHALSTETEEIMGLLLGDTQVSVLIFFFSFFLKEVLLFRVLVIRNPIYLPRSCNC